MSDQPHIPGLQAAFETIFQRYAYIQGLPWNEARELALSVMEQHGESAVNYHSVTAILDQIDQEVKSYEQEVQ